MIESPIDQGSGHVSSQCGPNNDYTVSLVVKLLDTVRPIVVLIIALVKEHAVRLHVLAAFFACRNQCAILSYLFSLCLCYLLSELYKLAQWWTLNKLVGTLCIFI